MMPPELSAHVTTRTAKGIADGVSLMLRNDLYSDGDKLPPIRDAAKALGVSPSTVAAAWGILARAGVVHSDGRRGTVVASQRHLGPARTRRVLTYATQFNIDLSTGLPDPELLPDIAVALGRVSDAGRLRSYLDEPVIPDLLDHLHHDWPFTADVITIADGAQDALDLIATSFLHYGDKVAIERLSDANLIDVLEFVGARLVPLEYDAAGVLPDSLAAALESGVKWTFLQPRAHHPTGTSWTSKRRNELGKVVQQHLDSIVVEIDFSGAVASSTLYSLGSVLPAQTIHIRGFSASHGPELRMAAVSGPIGLMESLLQRRHLGQGWTSRILQSMLLELLTNHVSVEQVSSARSEYRKRRELLIEELVALGIPAQGADGMHVYVPVHNESSALVALASRSIGVAPGTPYSVGNEGEPHIVVTAALVHESEIAVIAAALAEAAAPRQIANSGQRRSRVSPSAGTAQTNR